jgi:hypothetical protein
VGKKEEIRHARLYARTRQKAALKRRLHADCKTLYQTMFSLFTHWIA